MGRQIIAIDIDDVLSRSAEAVLAFTKEHWGLELTHEDYNEDLSVMWQITREEAEERWLKYLSNEPMASYGVIDSAKDVLTHLAQKYELVALTSRRVNLLAITETWLNTNYPGLISRVESSRIYGEGKENPHQLTKAEMLQELGASYLIDDQPKHCIGAAEVGVGALLFGGYPWNRDADVPSGVTKVRDWAEVLEYFDGL